MVEGRLFQVEKLDFDGRKAYVREVDCDYYTTRSPIPRSPFSSVSRRTRR